MEKKETLILISSSGSSRNIVNACRSKKKVSSVIALTDFSGKGKVSDWETLILLLKVNHIIILKIYNK